MDNANKRKRQAVDVQGNRVNGAILKIHSRTASICFWSQAFLGLPESIFVEAFPCEPALAAAKDAQSDKQVQGESGVTIIIGQHLIQRPIQARFRSYFALQKTADSSTSGQ